MAKVKQGSKRKRRSKVLPVLGAAGLSVTLASGASAAVDASATVTPARNSAICQQIKLGEEEIADVSLATFYVFDKDNASTVRPRRWMAMGTGGCGAACARCGGWTGTYYTGQVFSGCASPPPVPPRPHKRAHTSKNQ